MSAQLRVLKRRSFSTWERPLPPAVIDELIASIGFHAQNADGDERMNRLQSSRAIPAGDLERLD